MTEEAVGRPVVIPFRFVSYGVRVEICGSTQVMVDRAAAVARRSMIENLVPYSGKKLDVVFELARSCSGRLKMIQNGRRITSGGRSLTRFFKYFDSMFRIAIGEQAPEHVFIHAGVVGWRGKAILLPADSYQGKSTLVAELVRQGAEYYSDEYAIVDRDGLVHPFPRPISMRSDDGLHQTFELDMDDLQGTVGIRPLPVGLVLITGYKPTGRWLPKMLTPGNGVMQMIPFTLSITHRPEMAFPVLNRIARRATILSSPRGNAKQFAKILLDFVSKHEN